jgi:hypothetical protein
LIDAFARARVASRNSAWSLGSPESLDVAPSRSVATRYSRAAPAIFVSCMALVRARYALDSSMRSLMVTIVYMNRASNCYMCGNLKSTSYFPTIIAMDQSQHDLVLPVLRKYVTENSHVESSEAINDVVCALSDALYKGGLDDASMVPIAHKAFSFDTSVKWGFFLSVAFDPSEDSAPEFNVQAFNCKIAAVFDIGFAHHFGPYLESSDEEEDDDDDDEEEDEEEE